MEHSVMDRSLIRATMSYTRENIFRSWWYAISTLILVILSFAASIWAGPILVKIVLAFLAALFSSRLFVIYHDYQHEAILRNSLVARILMTCIGIFYLSPPSIWKWSHDHHHDHNAQFSTFVAGSFPLLTRKQFLALSKSRKIRYLAMRHPLTIVLAYPVIFLISFCIYPFLESPRKHVDCLVSLVIHFLFAYLLWSLGGWLTVLIAQILPFLLMDMLGGYIFYAQHNFPGVRLNSEVEWDYVFAALHSSSHIQMHPILQWATANVGIHHVHHINSRIPFYRLPEVMREIESFQRPRTTSLDPAEIRACLRLKLWDEERQQMIGLRELR